MQYFYFLYQEIKLLQNIYIIILELNPLSIKGFIVFYKTNP